MHTNCSVIFTFQQIRHHLAELSKKDHSLFDCCVVIILSHGTEVRTQMQHLPSLGFVHILMFCLAR